MTADRHPAGAPLLYQKLADELEAQIRRGQEKRSLPLEGAAEAAAELWQDLP